MDFVTAREIILNLLQTQGRIKNRECISAIGGNIELFEQIREDLVFNDLAQDKSNVGLVYIGQVSKKECIEEPLKIFDFTKILDTSTKDFCGREWLFRYLKEWELNEESRILTIFGSPGTGKSAFISRFIRTEKNVAAYHFCIPGLPETMSRSVFASSIITQIAGRLNLSGIRSGLPAGEKYEDERIWADIRKIISGMSSGKNAALFYICIDAPEESYFSNPDFPAFLSEFINRFPRNVKFVITCRKDSRILALLGRYDHIDIDAKREENRDDITEFLERKLSDKRLEVKSTEKKDIIEYITMKSDGNFLYAALMAGSLLSGDIKPRFLLSRSFPKDLETFYQKEFEKMFPTPDDYNQVAPVLSIIVGAVTPLTLAEISYFTGQDRQNVKTTIERISSFIPENPEGQYSCYHGVLLTWLTGGDLSREPVLAHRFRLNRNIAGHCIAECCLNAIDKNSLNKNGYCTRYLLYHLLTQDRYPEYNKVINNASFLKNRADLGLRHLLIVYFSDMKQSFINSLKDDMFRRGHIPFFVPFDKAGQNQPFYFHGSLQPIDAVILLLSKSSADKQEHLTTEINLLKREKKFILPLILDTNVTSLILPEKALDMRGIPNTSRNGAEFSAKVEILDRVVKNLSTEIPGMDEYLFKPDEESVEDFSTSSMYCLSRDIFISHKDADYEICSEIAEGIEKNFYSTWYYERDILPIIPHLIQTRNAIEKAQVFMVIITKNSVCAPQLDTEIVWAQSLGKPFVPILKDITFLQVQKVSPLWAQAIGASVAIPIPHKGVSAIIPRIVQGLQGAGIRPSNKKSMK